MGNFPQAFSHVSLINSAFRLSGTDPLRRSTTAPALIIDESITQSARAQRLKRLGRPAVRKRFGASR